MKRVIRRVKWCSVPSQALAQWRTVAQVALDEIEAAHRAVDHAYAVLVSSQFQGFCRDLHSEAVDFVASNMCPASVAIVLRVQMSQGRKLDSGNANPGNIGADFARFGMRFWPEVSAVDRRNDGRRRLLEELNAWRNAIAHQDWAPVGGSPQLQLRTVEEVAVGLLRLGGMFRRRSR